MNSFTPFGGLHMNGGGGGGGGAQAPQQRQSVDPIPDPTNSARMHGERNGALPVPVAGSHRPFGGMQSEMGGLGPRSPPKNKNTQHVPCKFFLQGQCQAGRMCPFSHDVESSTRPAPCKYFAKGGCKFGRKCALLHITPDGTIVNRTPQFGHAPPFPTAQPPPAPYAQPQPPPPGLLSMQAQGLEANPNGEMQQGFDNYQYGPRNGLEYPQIDVAYVSASPPYGSPLHDNRLGSSPPARGRSILDVPLPGSFDSNGVSMTARNGGLAASVPARFGVESPPSSLPRKSKLGNTALRDLHSSAFGDRGMDGVLAGSSPPSGPDEPLTFPKRALHSERLQAPRNQMISASLGTIGTKLPTQSFEYSDDDDVDIDREEDLLPASLRELIPEGRTRGGSKARVEDETSPASFLAAQRRTISGHGTPQDSKVGSPHSASPSRIAGFSAWPPRSSGFGFPSSTSRISSGDLSPTVGSPPRQASMSVLTQELQRTRLDAARSQATAVGMTRTMSNGSTGRSSLDRAVSGNGVGRERIDEEQELFDMDLVGDSSRSAPRTIPKNNNRSGGAWNNKGFGSSPGTTGPTFGAIGGHRTAK